MCRVCRAILRTGSVECLNNSYLLAMYDKNTRKTLDRSIIICAYGNVNMLVWHTLVWESYKVKPIFIIIHSLNRRLAQRILRRRCRLRRRRLSTSFHLRSWKSRFAEIHRNYQISTFRIRFELQKVAIFLSRTQVCGGSLCAFVKSPPRERIADEASPSDIMSLFLLLMF
jgi:hypothetical protein